MLPDRNCFRHRDSRNQSGHPKCPAAYHHIRIIIIAVIRTILITVISRSITVIVTVISIVIIITVLCIDGEIFLLVPRPAPAPQQLSPEPL